MSRTLLALFLSVAMVGILLALLTQPRSTQRAPATSKSRPDRAGERSSSDTALKLFCAASNQAVIEQVLRDYRIETGRDVVVQYGASQTLLSQIGLSNVGDLYLPADDSFLGLAEADNLVVERISIASMNVGLAVRRDSDWMIQSLDDLTDSGLRLVQGSPGVTAVGRLTKRVLQQRNDWERIADSTIAFRGTVTEVANDVLVGAADVGIVYDGMLHTYSELQFVPLREFSDVQSRVAIAVLSSSKDPTASLHLARYIAAEDHGLKTYEKHGFHVDRGDALKFRDSLSR